MKIANVLLKYSQPLAFTGCAMLFGISVFDRRFVDKFAIYKNIFKVKEIALFCNEDLRNLFMEVIK